MKATKKIVGAACALIAAVALSAGSTFAWFTSNAHVSMSQIQATVVTKGGDLQIAKVDVDGDGNGTIGKFKYKLDSTDVPTFEGKLDEVTTENGVVFNTRGATDTNQTTGVVTATGAVGDKEAGDSDAKLYKFSFALRSSTDMKIYFNAGTQLTSEHAADANRAKAANVFAWEDLSAEDYGKAVGKDELLETDAKNASRVSFAIWPTPSTPGVYAQPPQTAPTEPYNVKWWAPFDVKDPDSPGSAPKDGFYKGNCAQDYIINNITGSVDTKSAHYWLPEGKTSADHISILASDGVINSSNPESELLTLSAGVPTVVTLRLWIEGKDGDCLNYIFGDTIKLEIAFYGKAVESGSGA